MSNPLEQGTNERLFGDALAQAEISAAPGLLTVGTETISDEAARRLCNAIKWVGGNALIAESAITNENLPIESWRMVAQESMPNGDLRFSPHSPQQAKLLEVIQFIADGKYTPELRAGAAQRSAKAKEEDVLVNEFLFAGSNGILTDNQKTECVKLLGQIQFEGGDWPQNGFFSLPKSAVTKAQSNGALGRWEVLVNAGIIIENPTNYIIPKFLVTKFEAATDVKLAEAQQHYRQSLSVAERLGQPDHPAGRGGR